MTASTASFHMEAETDIHQYSDLRVRNLATSEGGRTEEDSSSSVRTLGSNSVSVASSSTAASATSASHRSIVVSKSINQAVLEVIDRRGSEGRRLSAASSSDFASAVANDARYLDRELISDMLVDLVSS